MSKHITLLLLLLATTAAAQVPSVTATSEVKLREGANTWFAPVWSLLATLKTDSTWAIAPGGGYTGKRITDNVYRTGKVSVGTTDTTAEVNVLSSPDLGQAAIRVSGNSDELLTLAADTRGDSISDFSIVRGFFNNVSEVGDNQVVSIGFNTTPGGGRKDPSKPSMTMRMEEKYDVVTNGILTPHFEFHLPQVDFENGGGASRPLSGYFGHRRSYGGSFSLETDYLSVSDFKTGVQRATWGFGTNTPYMKGIDFLDTASLRFNINNYPIFSQRNAANTGHIQALKVDNLDRVLLGGSGESRVAAYNQLQITNSGVLFNENGSIRIGKTGSPNAVEVFGGSGGEHLFLQSTSGGNEWVFGVSGNDLYMRSYTGGDYPWWVDKRGPAYTWRSTQTGDIGLGLYTPAAKLDILTSGGATAPLFRMRNSTGYSTMYRTTALPEGALTADPGDIALSAIAGVGRMWMKESGAGNTGWKEFLTPSNGITGSGAANQITYWSGTQGLTGSANGTYNGTDFLLNRTYTNTRDMNLVLNGNVPGINFRASTSASFSLFSGYYDANTLSIFHGAGTANPSTNIANFKSDGTVGIGTNSTSAMLHVAGTGRFDGTLTARGTGTQPTLYLDNATATTGKQWYIGSGNVGDLYIGNPTAADAITINGTTGATTIGGPLTVSTASGTATTVTGRTSAGVITDVTVGSGLSLSGGTLSATGGGGSPGGSSTQAQYNNSGSFDGATGLVFDGSENPDFTQAVSFSGDITPSNISGTTSDYAPTSFSTASTIRQTNSAGAILTGIAGGADGRTIIWHNIGSENLILRNENALSTAANRLTLGGGDLTLRANGTATFRYDATSSRWRLVCISSFSAGTKVYEYTTATANFQLGVPAGAKAALITVVGAGGGGGSGRKGASGANRCGGGGGAAGGLASIMYPLEGSDIATLYINVGAGGTGGAAQATNSTNGNAGGAGGDSDVRVDGTASADRIIRAQGGNGGAGGTTSNGTGGTASTVTDFTALAGGAAGTNGGVGTAGTNSNNRCPGPGGGAGGITSAGVINAGSTGGDGFQRLQAGGAQAANADAIANNRETGGGGGGSGGSGSGNALAGGNGVRGGGGGGGGASTDSSGNSGAGGNGGDGYVKIIIVF